MKQVFLFFMLMIAVLLQSNAQLPIIPKPNNILYKEGKFNYAKGFDVKIIRGDYTTQALQKNFVEFAKSKKIPIVSFSATTITLNLLKEKSDSTLTDAYTMQITPTSIAITSSSNAGLFYGIQNLVQIINSDSTKTIACADISDEPIFAYRGFHLDVAHQYISTAVIKQYLDVMSKLKLNKFQWQLADEKNCVIALQPSADTSASKNSYSPEEIKDIVKYAGERFITVIPEINLASITTANDSNSILATETLGKIIALFPSKQLHLSNTKIIPQTIRTYLANQSIAVIVRDIAPSKNETYQAYNSKKNGIAMAKNSTDVILSPRDYCSLDFQQDWDDEKKAFYMTYLPLDKAYSFNPLYKISDLNVRKHIIGSQACAPTQYIKDETELEYMVFPRLIALAECMWTSASNKKFKDFEARLKRQKNYFYKEKEIIIDLVHINPNKAKKKNK